MTMENDLVERLRDPRFKGQEGMRLDAASRIQALEAELVAATSNRDAARDNFLTMQASAAQLLKRAERAEAELARKTEALERQYPIIQSLGNLLDEYGRTQRDLSKLIGLRARASELVRGKRTLSKDMMELINNEWQIPIEELFATTRFVECRARSALEEKTDV